MRPGGRSGSPRPPATRSAAGRPAVPTPSRSSRRCASPLPVGESLIAEEGIDAAAAEEDTTDEEVLRSAMYAGFSTEEAQAFLQDRKNTNVSQVCFDAQFREDFWIDLGYPKGSRWWERSDSPILGDSVKFDPVEGSVAGRDVIGSSVRLLANSGDSSLCDLDFVPRIGTNTDQTKRSFVKGSSIQDPCAQSKPTRRGVHIRPWRGPLPRPGISHDVTLAAFWPTPAQSLYGVCSPDSNATAGRTTPQPPPLGDLSEFPPIIDAMIEPRSGPAGTPAGNAEYRNLNPSFLETDHVALVNRAKGYGLSRKLLRRPIPWTCRHVVPHFGCIPMSAADRPSYAVMAARQPTREEQRPPALQPRGGGVSVLRGGRGPFPRPNRGRGNAGGRDRVQARGNGRGWFNPVRGRGSGQVQDVLQINAMSQLIVRTSAMECRQRRLNQSRPKNHALHSAFAVSVLAIFRRIVQLFWTATSATRKIVMFLRNVLFSRCRGLQHLCWGVQKMN
jgi:hypothetical protein